MRVEEYKGYGENRWFFFTVREQSSSNKEKEPSRKVRVKGVTATWKATGSVQLIRRARSKVVVGSKRVLIYNSSDTAENGKWSMHEYILKDHAAVCFSYAVQQCVSPRGKSMYEASEERREGSWSERMRIGNSCSIRRNKALRRMCFGARGAVSSAQCVLTSDAGPDTLVPIGGCYRLIDIPMSNCFNSGINKIFVMTQFNSASLNRHIHRTYLGGGINFTDGSVEVLAATQMPGEAAGWFQGTADAVRKFIWVLEDYYKHKAIEHILILSGDQLYRMDYMELVQKHVDDNADITLSCAPVGESRASDYGLVKFDSSGRVIQFSEKPKGAALEEMKVDTSFLNFAIDDPTKYPYIASMGVYVFKRDVLLDLLKSRYAELHDFGSEILPKALHEHNVQAYVFTDYWEDIGTIRSFFDANMALCEQIKDAIISHGCFLRECAIEHSIVGVRSRLNSGCELKNTMMMGADLYETEDEISRLLSEGKVPIGVGENTKISNCIIDMNARVGRNVSITNTEVSKWGETSFRAEIFFVKKRHLSFFEKRTTNNTAPR
nr:NAC protein [Saccharum spontaneum]